MHEAWMEKIDNYLNGRMSPEDRSHFESEMAADPELSSTFRIYQVIETEMRAAETYRPQDASLKNVLANLSAAYMDAEAVPAVQPGSENNSQHQPVISEPVPDQARLIKINWGKRLAIAAG